MQCFKRLLTVSILSASLSPSLVMADEKKEQQPDEAFLEFLASMSDIDGKMSDPLDMLEVADNDFLNDSKIEAEVETKVKSEQVPKSNLPTPDTKVEGPSKVELEPGSTLMTRENI